MNYSPQQARCPDCSSLKVVKRGVRKTKTYSRQLFQCTRCKRHFSLSPLPGYNYPVRAILTAPVLYYTGHPLDKVRQLITARYGLNPSVSTVYGWVKEFGKYAGLKNERRAMQKQFTPRGLIYKQPRSKDSSCDFRVHRYKLNTRTALVPGLFRYLDSLVKGKLVIQKDWFKQHASRTDLGITVPVRQPKDQYVSKMSDLAVKLSWSNYQRHELVEQFFLVMDSSTIACEVPVYLTGKEASSLLGIKGGILGHMDLLQVRKEKIYITDYKPDSRLEKNAADQLLVYALGLSARTGIHLKHITCGWFDEEGSYAFSAMYGYKRLKKKNK